MHAAPLADLAGSRRARGGAATDTHAGDRSPTPLHVMRRSCRSSSRSRWSTLIVGGGSAARTSAVRPEASMWASISASDPPHPGVGCGDVADQVVGEPDAAGRRSSGAARSARRRPPRSVPRSSGPWSGRPASCSDGSSTRRDGDPARRRSSGRGCRSAPATSRCPCPGTGAAAGCGGRPPARRHARRVTARRRAARRWPMRRRQHAAAGSELGLRYVAGDSWTRAGSRWRAIGGTAGRSHQPVAITTLAARQRPPSGDARRTRRPRRRGARPRSVFLDRSRRSVGVVLEVGGHLAGGHEAVGVGPARTTSRAAGSSSSE